MDRVLEQRTLSSGDVLWQDGQGFAGICIVEQHPVAQDPPLGESRGTTQNGNIAIYEAAMPMRDSVSISNDTFQWEVKVPSVSITTIYDTDEY